VRILVTNDDGLRSPGIRALHEVASNFGEAVVVAPDRDRSGISAAITLAEPLRVRQTDRSDVFEVVSGTPTDCVYVGINHVLKDNPPDLVLSGINPGPNLGWDVLYSGTVAGAREGVLQGIPAVAFSLMPGPEMPYDEIKSWVAHVIERVIAEPPPPYVCLNVNIPNPRKGPLKGLEVTQLGQRFYSKDMTVRHDPRGNEYLWIGGSNVHMPDIPGSDCNAIRAGMISVTPLACDVTCTDTLSEMQHWTHSNKE
jgi:5'-nucleotidase